jgi:2-alkenal reductase
MRIFAIPLALFLSVAAASGEISTSRNLTPNEQLRIDVFRQAAPSVVHVAVQNASGSHGQPQDEYGTGFIWDKTGHVVTNTHVVRHAKRIIVVMPSGEVAATDIVGLAPYYDMAVLQLHELSRLPPAIPLGDSAALEVGQSVYAIGNPFGLDQTLTTGVISALQRRTRVNGKHEIADAIQIDAATNPGNSGGPLLDSSGHLIGVNTAILSPSGTWSGVGFAIPVATVKRVVPELIQTGHASIPGIGIVAAPQSASVLANMPGVVIAKVNSGTPASQAGLKGSYENTSGDVIIAADHVPIRSLADLDHQIVKKGIGNEIDITLLRQSRPRDVTLKIIDEAEGGSPSPVAHQSSSEVPGRL